MFRWILAVSILTAATGTCIYSLLRYQHIRSHFLHDQPLPISKLFDPPPPDYIPADFLSILLTRTGLDEKVPDNQQKRRLYLERLTAHLEISPWVKSVRFQTDPPVIRVEWSRPIPISFRSRHNQVLAYGLANERGILLSTDSPPAQSLLPIYVYADSPPPLTVGEALPPVLSRPCILAAFLDSYRSTLQLDAILVGHDPISIDIRLKTKRGSLVLWERLDSSLSSNISDEHKLNRLLQYVQTWKSLDLPAGPYLFDNRHPEALFRGPLP